MPFPASLATATVTGQFMKYPGEPANGTVTFTTPGGMFLQSSGDDIFVAPFTVSIALDVDGAFEVELPVTSDAQWLPIGWTYAVNVSVEGSTLIGSLSLAEVEDGQSIDLADRFQPSAATPGAQYLLVTSVGQPNGVAGLDEDGLVPLAQLPEGFGEDHTHTIADVTGLQAALDGKSGTSHTHVEYAESLHTHAGTYSPVGHGHVIGDVTSLQDALDGKVNTATLADYVQVDSVGEIGGPAGPLDGDGKIPVSQLPGSGGGSVDWADLVNVPATFPPSAHSHTIVDVTGLSAELADKADATHTHVRADITDSPWSVSEGGTGVAALTSGSFLQGNGTGAVALRTPSQVRSDIGAAASTHTHSADDVTAGTLPVARGGTGVASVTANSYLKGNGTSALVPRTYAEVLSDIGAAATAHTHTPRQTAVWSYSGAAVASSVGTARWYNRTGSTLTVHGCWAAANTAPTGAALVVDVNKNGTTMYATGKPSISAASNVTALVAPPSAVTLADGDYVTVDIDSVGSTVAGSDVTIGMVFSYGA